MKKKKLGVFWGLGIVACGLAFGTFRMKSDAAFDAPYYDITTSGGEFDGVHYVLDGKVVANAFFYDGSDTYYLQDDGTPMTERLTYHPDGEHVIYFDEDGHEVFNNFAHVTTSIEGNTVDDYCYFDVYGHMYVNVLTYDQSGTKLYYINPYGVMERGGVFELDTNADNYAEIAGGCYYGYANEDGSIRGFYRTKQDAENDVCYESVKGEWKVISEGLYSVSGDTVNRKEYTYDEKGRKTEEKYYSIQTGTSEERLMYVEKYIYNGDGTLYKSVKDTYGQYYSEDWYVVKTTTNVYDEQQRVKESVIEHYMHDSIGRTEKIIYDYQITETENSYTETKVEDIYNFSGNFESLTSCWTNKETTVYENGRLVKTESFSNYGGDKISLWLYEYEDDEGVFNPETNTIDYESRMKCYWKLPASETPELSYYEIIKISMTDANNGTKTVYTYNSQDIYTGIREYRITDGEEILLSEQSYNNSVGSAYQYVQMEDGWQVMKEYHTVYSANWSFVSTTKEPELPLYNSQPGDKVSFNTMNKYSAKWIQFDINRENDVTEWKYTLLPDEEWKQMEYYLVDYEFLAVE